MALKHSKFKNTGLLFELLVRQVTADMLENKDSVSVGMIKKYFANSELGKEYAIYKNLSTLKGLQESKAAMLIDNSIQAQKKLSQATLRKEKYALISEIKTHYNIDEFFKSKIENYKLYASIYLLFEAANTNDSLDPKKTTEVKFSILESLTRSANADMEKDPIMEEFKNSDPEVRLLTYKLLVDKFNSKYNGQLNVRQKSLLREYVNEVTMSPKLKDYVNEELEKVKHDLKVLLPGIQDKVIQIKIKQIAEIIKPISKTKSVSDEDVVNLFNYYQLIEELKK